MSLPIRVVCLSDTHLRHDFAVPCGDLLVHAGDLMSRGKTFDEFDRVQAWLLSLVPKFKEVVIIPGNHDWLFQTNLSLLRELLPGVHVLVDQGVALDIDGRTVSIYGTPSQPRFYNWAFNHSEETMNQHYSRIPAGLDILLTHCPPYGILDIAAYSGKQTSHRGCQTLLPYVMQTKPKLHVFGHIHWLGGMCKAIDGTIFVNACVCDEKYEPTHTPLVVEI